MEPRPQQPRPQPQSGNTPPAGGPPQQPQVGPDPAQQTQQYQPQPGFDPSAFSAPPRSEYDYSPLDLQPPGQRRKRQVIAGIIGALVVVAIGALIIAGWMAVRDDDKSVDPTPTNDRVAELNSTPTEPAETTTDGTTPAANETEAAEAPAPTQVPATEAPAATVYTAESIRGTLPVVESMPGAFSEGGDSPQDLPTVVEALGGGPEVETMLTNNGWQAAMTRTFVSDDPVTTGTTIINVSSHAFKDAPSALAALPEYSGILQGFGWSPVEGEQYGDGSTTLTWTNPETGEEAVTIYFVQDQLLYRVYAIGPAEFDSTPNVVHVVRQILGV